METKIQPARLNGAEIKHMREEISAFIRNYRAASFLLDTGLRTTGSYISIRDREGKDIVSQDTIKKYCEFIRQYGLGKEEPQIGNSYGALRYFQNVSMPKAEPNLA